MRYVCCIVLMAICSFAQGREGAKNWKAKTENAGYIHRAIKEVTDVMVYDIYSPPVASRTYAYITVAGYETAINADPKYVSFAGQLHRSEEHTSELQSPCNLVCRLLLEKKKKQCSHRHHRVNTIIHRLGES